MYFLEIRRARELITSSLVVAALIVSALVVLAKQVVGIILQNLPV